MGLKQVRLEALADGIFAIVMTLLVFELKVPTLPEPITNEVMLNYLWVGMPVFLSFVLSFALLFTYWKAHHFIVSVYAKNIDARLASWNALFFFFVAVIPFTAHLLGAYYFLQIVILIYGLNVIFIGLTLFYMRKHITNSNTIENEKISRKEYLGGTVRIFVPVVMALIAIVIGYFNTVVALVLFTIGVAFNILPNSTAFFYKILYKEEKPQKKGK